jgi:hypothetical protein
MDIALYFAQHPRQAANRQIADKRSGSAGTLCSAYRTIVQACIAQAGTFAFHPGHNEKYA